MNPPPPSPPGDGRGGTRQRRRGDGDIDGDRDDNRDEDINGDYAWHRDTFLNYPSWGGRRLFPHTLLIFLHPPTGSDRCSLLVKRQDRVLISRQRPKIDDWRRQLRNSKSRSSLLRTDLWHCGWVDANGNGKFPEIEIPRHPSTPLRWNQSHSVTLTLFTPFKTPAMRLFL